jgi:hypothetical protein
VGVEGDFGVRGGFIGVCGVDAGREEVGWGRLESRSKLRGIAAEDPVTTLVRGLSEMNLMLYLTQYESHFLIGKMIRCFGDDDLLDFQ